MKDYMTDAINSLVEKRIKEITPGIKFALKKEIVKDLLIPASDTFNSVTLDIEKDLSYFPIDANSIVVYREGTSTYYKRYDDWICDRAAGTITFLSTGDIVAGTNIVVEYKYYLSSLNDIAQTYGANIMVKELVATAGKGIVEVGEIRCSATANIYSIEEIILI